MLIAVLLDLAEKLVVVLSGEVHIAVRGIFAVKCSRHESSSAVG